MFEAFVISDVHAGNNLPHSIKDEHGVSDRLIDSCEALEWSFKMAESLNVPLYCLGDFFDERLVDSVTLKYIGETLSGRTIYIVPGNHDASDQTNKHFSIEGVKAFGANFKILTDYVDNDLNIAAIQFCELGELNEWLDENAAKNLMLMSHMEVVGFGNGDGWKAKVGVPENSLSKWGAVLSGHFHRYQKFISTQGCFVGALRQLNFGDEDKQQGGWYLKWDGKHLEMEFYKLESPSFATLSLKAEEVNNLTYIPECSYLKFKISGTIDQLKLINKKELKETVLNSRTNVLNSRIRRIVIEDLPEKHHTKQRMNADSDTSLLGLVTEYVKSPSIHVGDLDTDKLSDIGKKIVNEATIQNKEI